jgi:hypothetical protein
LLVRAIGPDQFETGEAGLEWGEQHFAALMVLEGGFMDQHVHQHASHNVAKTVQEWE